MTITDELLTQVRDELRVLNAHFGGAEPSGPKVADGLTVTEQAAEPDTCREVTARGDVCGRDRPCRYHDTTEEA